MRCDVMRCVLCFFRFFLSLSLSLSLRFVFSSSSRALHKGKKTKTKCKIRQGKGKSCRGKKQGREGKRRRDQAKSRNHYKNRNRNKIRYSTAKDGCIQSSLENPGQIAKSSGESDECLTPAPQIIAALCSSRSFNDKGNPKTKMPGGVFQCRLLHLKARRGCVDCRLCL
ncbi:hypothetical protein QBC45DRAFT_34505 [Copromyces sp. CBS 386.78]|nr:hypothetical protein QBC45DRAFT_34505 [Copromyces sp. CBS 386.78]